ncbi:hypothetical protein [Mesorhizobium sp. B2-3-4]|uniref:hypothetical protein n=1 Tax=Mesorhizobium sp. B2-3-4 TaxID=2589959 RepID=UPI001128402D|nr:hypothetical protein [Mesorhizobium sp. B2-3-4]TPM39584.1 hypothetical protein FJ967_08865 [Mesorhizobium sp. B2-3-4]
MADLFAVAGAKISIGPAMTLPSTDLTLSNFTGITWTDIDGWSNCGPVGDNSALITTALINRGRDVKQKGTKNAPSMDNVFAVNSTDVGQLALIAAALTKNNYPFRIIWADVPAVVSATVTMTIASPGVVSWANHGLQAGDAFQFSTTGALPTGVTAGTTYYVLATGLTSGAFQFAATAGGTAIVTSGTQSGVHTGTTVPSGTTNYFAGLVMNASQAGGDANTVRNLNSTIEINSNIVTVPAAQ